MHNECLSCIPPAALDNLYQGMVSIERDNINGVVIEAGCALGGSSIVIATAKSRQRPMYIYDVFGMIPPPSNNDGKDVHKRYKTIKNGNSKGIRGNKYYGYHKNLINEVETNLTNHNLLLTENNISLIKGLFQDTMKINEAVAFAHIDGDWYESVMTCLQQIEPNIANGGLMIVDDYYFWSGARKAVDKYFKNKHDKYLFKKMAGRLHIIQK